MSIVRAEFLDFIAGVIITQVRTELAEIGLTDSRIINRVSYTINGDTLLILLPYYYKYIESGRRAGARMPPAAPIIAWMKRKRIAPGDENRVSWAIRKGISKNGIKPRPFLDKSITGSSDNVDAIIEIEFSQLIDKEIGSFFAS